jgi:hypothetical protein
MDYSYSGLHRVYIESENAIVCVKFADQVLS